MSEEWAERQRHTHRLARRLADYLFTQSEVAARQLYGLSQLSWITNSSEGVTAGYISRVKIPALGNILGREFSGNPSLDQVAEIVAKEFNDNSLIELVKGHSGFTNLYGAYRNSALCWIVKNYSTLLPLYKSAYDPEGEEARLKTVEEIAKLPKIPKPNDPERGMKPEYFLTPVFFILDPKIRFPIINGRKNVQNLLKDLGVKDSDLISQYRAMIGLYGKNGINDAADLDQIQEDWPDFLDTSEQTVPKQLLKKKDITTGELPLKDEADIESIRKSGTVVHRQVHNRLTNQLRDLLKKFTLLEGRVDACMFDVLVKRYDSGGNDLLIEVKSSIERPHVRMAVGQLFDYQFKLKKDKKPHLAVLLPKRPNEEVVSFLKWMCVGLMWFEDGQLCTVDDRLGHIACKG